MSKKLVTLLLGAVVGLSVFLLVLVAIAFAQAPIEAPRIESAFSVDFSAFPPEQQKQLEELVRQLEGKFRQTHRANQLQDEKLRDLNP